MSFGRQVYWMLLRPLRPMRGGNTMFPEYLAEQEEAHAPRLMLVPVILGAVAFAADLPPSWEARRHTPLLTILPSFSFVSIAIGVCAGLITGCIGAGGGFIITPALMSAGIKGILAARTDLFHIFAKAIMGPRCTESSGNVSVTLAVAFLVGSGVGVLGGGVITGPSTRPTRC